MERKLSIFVVAVVVLGCAVGALGQDNSPSLGDYARAARKAKPEPPASSAPKVYDNDNMPKESTLSVVGNESASPNDQGTDAQASTDKPAATKSADAKDKDKLPEIKPGESTEDRQKAIGEWKDKLKGQQDKIAQLSHELDLLQREYRVKAAEFYGNTARRTQNPTGFAQEDADYKKQIAEKQQAVDDAKAKLSQMQDDARKQGAPESISE
ncbi:MAG TPA: hypothetical protein VF447_08220 [Terriglobales bacterium]|jgi:hypothetical protein